MPRVYFCVGSFYGTYLPNLMAHLRTTEHSSYSILLNEQRGPDRELSGFAYVYNRLIQAAFSDQKCERVWILGDDVIPTGRCLIETEVCLLNDKTIGVIFPTEAWHKEERLETIRPYDGVTCPIEEAMNHGPIQFEQLFAGFACACITRAAWESVGVMDESIGLGYAEDLEWGIRCWQEGYRVVNYRRAWFWHKRGATYERLIKDGKYTKEAPYEAAESVKKRYPWLWNGEPREVTMQRVKDWYRVARERRGESVQ